MGRKVFISFLGVGNYLETYYQLDDRKTEHSVRFIQEALIRLDFMQWGEEDQVFIFCTEQSYQSNWLDNGQKRATEHLEKIGLSSVLSNLSAEGFKPHIESIRISEGFSEQEIWSIFNTVYKTIDESAEIYFDMTHAFRSIPFFSFALFNYSGFLKNTSLKCVYYGAFEKLGNASEARKLPIGERIAPILDLKNIIELQQLVIAANDYKRFGRMGELSLSLNHYTKTALSSKKKAGGSKKQTIQLLQKDIVEFEKNIATCRGKLLIEGGAVIRIRQNIQKVMESGVPQPIVEILKSITTITDRFSANSLDNLYAAIEWCLEYGMIQQAYTLGQEFIITNICSKLSEINPFKKEIPKDKERKFRDYISSILGIKEEYVNVGTQWNGDLAKYYILTRLMFQLSWVRALRLDYAKITSNRNQINHGGFVGKLTAKEIIEQLKEPLTKCLEIMRQDLELPVIVAPDGLMLINLSNHPYESWSVAQKQAAVVFGPCIDLPFPPVDAEAGEEIIKQLVTEYLLKVEQLSQGKEVVVHLMGEMTLTFALVAQLRKRGISCVASTSERSVIEHSSGYKEVLFDFKRFRQYT